MDEAKKAASVAQLKELHDLVVPRLDALESEDSKESSDPAVDVLSRRLLMLETKLDACIEKMSEPVAPPAPPDLSPVLNAITQLNTMMVKFMEGLSRPVTKTGEAILPDGGKIKLQVSETRM